MSKALARKRKGDSVGRVGRPFRDSAVNSLVPAPNVVVRGWSGLLDNQWLAMYAAHDGSGLWCLQCVGAGCSGNRESERSQIAE